MEVFKLSDFAWGALIAGTIGIVFMFATWLLWLEESRSAAQWCARYRQLRRESDEAARTIARETFGPDAEIIALHATIVRADGRCLWYDMTDRPVRLHELRDGAEETRDAG